jgi:SprT protein
MKGVSEELHSRVMKRLHEVTDIVNAKYNSNIKVPTVTYNLKGRIAGKAYWHGQIKLNAGIFLTHIEDFIHRTVAHEMMHICCYRLYPRAKGHGREWKSLMHLIGVEASRCHSYDVSTSLLASGKELFSYSCNCKTHSVGKVKHNNMQRLGPANYKCRSCKHGLTFLGKLGGPDVVNTIKAVEKPIIKTISTDYPKLFDSEKVGAYVQRLIKSFNLDNETILMFVKRHYKDSNYGKKEVAWNRWKIKQS